MVGTKRTRRCAPRLIWPSPPRSGRGKGVVSRLVSAGKVHSPGLTEPTLARGRGQAQAPNPARAPGPCSHQSQLALRYGSARTAGRTRHFPPAPLTTALCLAASAGCFRSFRRPQSAETVTDRGAPKDERPRWSRGCARPSHRNRARCSACRPGHRRMAAWLRPARTPQYFPRLARPVHFAPASPPRNRHDLLHPHFCPKPRHWPCAACCLGCPVPRAGHHSATVQCRGFGKGRARHSVRAARRPGHGGSGFAPGWRGGCLQAGAMTATRLGQPRAAGGRREAVSVTAQQPGRTQRHIVHTFIPAPKRLTSEECRR